MSVSRGLASSSRWWTTMKEQEDPPPFSPPIFGTPFPLAGRPSRPRELIKRLIAISRIFHWPFFFTYNEAIGRLLALFHPVRNIQLEGRKKTVLIYGPPFLFLPNVSQLSLDANPELGRCNPIHLQHLETNRWTALLMRWCPRHHPLLLRGSWKKRNRTRRRFECVAELFYELSIETRQPSV